MSPFRILVTIFFSAFFIFGTAYAMDSTNYKILWDSVNSGGEDTSSSTNYQLRDTIGEQATGISSSTNYEIRAGYRQGITDPTVLTFNIGTQENATQTTWSAFSNAGKTVDVASVANYSVGNFIAVVENEGLSQIVAIGKIADITGTTITVDKWEGSPSSISATPAGGDDYVYRLEGSAVSFGTLTSATANTSLTHTSFLSNAENGYTLYVNTNGGLVTAGSATIAPVTDGEVTTGSEEYGARVFGTTATSTGSDFELSTSTRAIQESTTFADDDRIVLVYKISISSFTAAGAYSQNVFYTVTPNF